MIRIIEDLVGDWSRLYQRIESVTDEIETLARGDEGCRQLMTVPAALAQGRSYEARVKPGTA
jgi:transposase